MRNVSIAVSENDLIVRASDGMLMQPKSTVLLEETNEVAIVCDTPQGVQVAIPVRKLFVAKKSPEGYEFDYYVSSAEELNKANLVEEVDAEEVNHVHIDHKPPTHKKTKKPKQI